MIELEIPGVPLPWKAPFVGSRGTFSPRHREMILFRSLVKEQYQGHILDVAISCDLTFYMPIPKSASQKKRLKMISGEIRPEGTPDRCNLCKLFEDVLQGIVIKNDSKIVDGRVAKYYGEVPRTVIHIEVL